MKQRFTIGDKVLISRRVPSRSNGWNNTWVPLMSKFVGNSMIYTVASIEGASFGYRFLDADGNAVGFSWPDDALDPAHIIISHEMLD